MTPSPEQDAAEGKREGGEDEEQDAAQGKREGGEDEEQDAAQGKRKGGEDEERDAAEGKRKGGEDEERDAAEGKRKGGEDEGLKGAAPYPRTMIAPHIASLGVAEAAARVVEQARDVQVDAEAIQRFCDQYPGGDLPIPEWNQELHWSDGTWRSANYTLILDALNFCFWADPGQPRWTVEYRGQSWHGYWGLAAALRKAIEAGVPVLEASYLATLTLDDVARLLEGEGPPIPLLPARHAHLVELGTRLQESYGGRFSAAIEAARHDALDLVALTVRDFPCYRDEATYEGLRVPLYKRAQILAVDLFGTFGGQAWGRLSRLDAITAFADYKVPQVLRRLGIMRYSPALAACLDALQEIPAGDPREVEIRAATIDAVERIRTTLAERMGRAPRSFEIDWYLWGIGQERSPEDRPYHRTRTTAY